ncbi:MAG TPA: hypothetical protein VFX19_10940 [Dehalococcoidia bacterium]|jgi:hypothetical protein|nr:hypothetical protein [Dehalococcoidia bacterium]
MASIEIQLRQEEAKLVFLAVAYHLGRPGSELDPITKQPVEHGLAEVASALQPQLHYAVATITVRENQARRLLSGMAGSISELKTYPMLQLRVDASGAARRSTVPGFDRSLLHLFPEVEDDTEQTLGIAEQMLMLRRRLDEVTADLEPDEPEPAPQKRKSWWPFGRKT